MKYSIPRLARVTFKDTGFTIQPLPTYSITRDREIVQDWCTEVLDAHTNNAPDIAGFAFIVFSSDNSSTCKLSTNRRSRIPPTLVPHFVKDRLFAEKVMEWANENNGTSSPPSPEGA